MIDWSSRKVKDRITYALLSGIFVLMLVIAASHEDLQSWVGLGTLNSCLDNASYRPSPVGVALASQACYRRFPKR